LENLNSEMDYEIWYMDVRSLNKSGSLTTVGREFTIYKLDLVVVQEVRWDMGGNLRAGDCCRIYVKENHQFRKSSFTPQNNISS
jgi:hypothetical protein